MLFYNKETKFNFKKTQGLNVIQYGLYSLDKDKDSESKTSLTVKVRFSREDFIRLKQHIDTVLERQKKSPDDWMSVAVEQLPYLKGNSEELLHPDFVPELQRCSDFLDMLVASNSPHFYFR